MCWNDDFKVTICPVVRLNINRSFITYIYIQLEAIILIKYVNTLIH